MAPSSSKYPYYAVHQMHPLLPSEPRLDGLRPLAAQVIGDAKDLAAHGMPHLRDLLRDALRPMNSYYTNKIEGQHTEPLLIEQAMQQELGAQATAIRSQTYYLDVTPPGRNKGTFVQAMATRLGITTDAVATIGDMQNDIAMFKTGGVSFAMGNASDDVKRQATRVTASNEEDGFALAMEAILEENPGN